MKFSLNLNYSLTSELTEEQRKREDSIIMFTIVDWDYLGLANQYIADGFMMFKDIFDVNEINKPRNLILSKPPSEGERQKKFIEI